VVRVSRVSARPGEVLDRGSGHQLVQELDYGGKQPFEQDSRLCVQPPGYQLAQAPFCAATVTIRRGQDASPVGAQTS
jgi:hypothetical protein